MVERQIAVVIALHADHLVDPLHVETGGSLLYEKGTEMPVGRPCPPDHRSSGNNTYTSRRQRQWSETASCRSGCRNRRRAAVDSIAAISEPAYGSVMVMQPINFPTDNWRNHFSLLSSRCPLNDLCVALPNIVVPSGRPRPHARLLHTGSRARNAPSSEVPPVSFRHAQGAKPALFRHLPHRFG